MFCLRGELDIPEGFVDCTELWLYFRPFSDYEHDIYIAQLEFRFDFWPGRSLFCIKASAVIPEIDEPIGVPFTCPQNVFETQLRWET